MLTLYMKNQCFKDEFFQVSEVGCITLRFSGDLVKGREEEPYLIHAKHDQNTFFLLFELFFLLFELWSIEF